MSHNTNDDSSYLGLSVNPVPASRLREVSAALLCFKDCCRLPFHVQYIVPCIPNADRSFTLFFPCYSSNVHELLIALLRCICFHPSLCGYPYFLLSGYGVFVHSLLYKIVMLMLSIPQQNLHDLCIRVFVYVVHNNLFSMSSFLSVCANALDFALARSISNEMHGPAMRTFPRGGGVRYIFQFDAIEPHLHAGCDITKDSTFAFVDHVDSTGLLLYPANKNFVHVSIPLKKIVPFLSVKLLLKIAKLHHIPLGSHVPKSKIIHSFHGHSCVSCNLYYSVFSVLDSKSSKTKKQNQGNNLDLIKSSLLVNDAQTTVMADDNSPTSEHVLVFPLDPVLEHVEYPPPPFDDVLSRKIISNFCENSNKTSIEEAGCGVCGQLVPTVQLTRLKAVKNILTVLQAPDVTRIQRRKDSDPIRGYKGPVLDYSCASVCNGCRQYLRNGKVPRNALANGLWLGAVPEELACLSGQPYK